MPEGVKYTKFLELLRRRHFDKVGRYQTSEVKRKLETYDVSTTLDSIDVGGEETVNVNG